MFPVFSYICLRFVQPKNNDSVSKTLKIILVIIFALIVALLVWRFSDIVFYLIFSAILSLIGRPLIKMFNSVRIGKFRLPSALSATLTILVMIVIVLLFMSMFVPLIAKQAAVISNIDFNSLSQSLEKPIMNLELFLRKYSLLQEHENIRQILQNHVNSLVSFASFSDTFSSIVGITGSIFIAVFSIVFLTFFFIKDNHMIDDIIDALTPANHQQEIQNIMIQTKHLLSRYFIGIAIEVSTMMTLISIGLSVFGIQNALLIGFFGGLMNIIPYLGPIIGAVVGSLLAVSTMLSFGLYQEIISTVLIVVSVFAGANLIDNLVLQPLIYSNSVKAHPVEIYLVILIAGSLAGITGMVLAIPFYTVLRIIAKEFFSQFRIVQRLTRNI
ncbi:MAG: AI-2E family transporter [Sphingobacteriia bacterium]|nr:AI-2E family transporter [Sphingobacteriia bacterium]